MGKKHSAGGSTMERHLYPQNRLLQSTIVEFKPDVLTAILQSLSERIAKYIYYENHFLPESKQEI